MPVFHTLTGFYCPFDCSILEMTKYAHREEAILTGIVTVTASAAIDRTYHLDRVVPGDVNRADSVSSELSGKGVNVAAAIAQTPLAVRAVVPLSSADQHWTGGASFFRPVEISRDTRVNISLIESGGLTTKVNEQAVPLERAEWDAIVEATVAALDELGGGWVVLCGTIPPLAGTDSPVPFEELLTAASDAGARLAVDTSGDGLRNAIAHPARLDLIKPNTHELAELLDRDLLTIGDVVDAARHLQYWNEVDTVFVSMGADGALVVGPDDYRLAEARAEQVINTVGAGDASLAGYLVAAAEDSGNLDLAAERAASWGALAVSQSGTVLQGPEHAPVARTSVPDRSTKLTEPGRA